MVKKTKALGEGLFDAGGSVKYTHEIKSLTPLRNNVIVRNMNFSGRKLSSGIMLLSDDGKAEGIRPRWAEVFAVGPEQKDVAPGQWILVEHGRWSRGLEVDINDNTFTIQRVDPDCIIFVSDTEPTEDDHISDAVAVAKNTR